MAKNSYLCIIYNQLILTLAWNVERGTWNLELGT